MGTAQTIGFDDETLIQKVQPKFKFQEGEKSHKKRILFLTNKLVKDTIHVIPDNGFIKCLDNPQTGQRCPACDSGNFKKARYGVHVLEYATNPSGQPNVPFSFQVKAFYFAKGTAEKLQNLFVNMGDQFQKLDVIVACENPTYQLINFTPVIDSKGSAFSQQQEEAKKVMREDIKRQMADIDLSDNLAAVVDEVTMNDMLSGKIKRYTPRTAPQAADQAAAQPPAQGGSAAQAALTLTSTPPAASGGAGSAAPSPAPSKAQNDAQKMMEDLSI